MQHRTLTVAAAAVIVVTAFSGRSVSLEAGNDDVEICNQYGELDTVFVGIPQSPVTFHVSGEPGIERARQDLADTKKEVEAIRASLDPTERLKREREFVIRIAEAEEELDRRRAMYPPPYDITLIPVYVDRPLRGVMEPTLMVRQAEPALKLEAGKPYLMGGYRSRAALPPFPEMSSDLVNIVDYIDVATATSVDRADQELEFLGTTIQGATVTGSLRMRSTYHGDFGGPPLDNVTIVLSAEGRSVETTTRADGSFTAAGVPGGRIEIKPLLNEGLTIVNKAALTLDLREGACRMVNLSAAVNSRVSGRILAKTPKDFEIVLLGLDSGGGIAASSNVPWFSALPGADGAFEFVGVPTGSYVLAARHTSPAAGQLQNRATYYPGTNDPAIAVPIVVGQGTQHDGFEFVVPE